MGKDLTTSNIQIDHYFAQNKHYQGCLSKGTKGFRLNPNSFLILNEDAPNGSGTHWVLASSLGGDLMYFNSFGLAHDAQVCYIMRGTKSSPKIKYSTLDLQPLSSTACGEFCIAEANKLLAIVRNGAKTKPSKPTKT